MTYPENRQPLTGEDLAKLHPSTCQQECEQLRAENEALRTGDWSQLRLVRFANGQFDFSAGPVRYIAEYFAQMFEAGEGEYFNNMEIEFDHAKAGPMVLSAQRRAGKTPVQQRKEAEEEAKALRLKLSEAESRASWAEMTKNRATDEAKALRIENSLLIEERDRALAWRDKDWQASQDNTALRARVATLEAALRVYADGCDGTDSTPCGYQGNLCCRTARAALQQESGENDAITEVYRLRIAITHALARLDESRFSNSEHQQAKDTLRAALEAKP